MKKHKFLGFLLLVLFFSCIKPLPLPDNASEKTEPVSAESIEIIELPPEEEPQPDILTIIATGDNLYHDVMVRNGEQGDYESAYQEIRPLTEKADIAFINQETLLAGESFGFSGYPQFNSPQKLGRAVAAAGFNVVNHANNHVMDKGEKAVFATMDFWDAFPEIKILGIHRTRETRRLPALIEKNNIKVGFLAYTYGTNYIPIPADKPYLVSLINRRIMEEEINALRPLCDFLVVSMHWGEEYFHNYSREQENLAAFLAEHKVDMVIGHHPHVIQPAEYIMRPDGRYMLCFYSLGNLISAMNRPPTILGAMAYVKIKKIPSAEGEEADSFMFMDAGAIPLVTHFENNFIGFKIYPLYTYTVELAARHRINRERNELTMKYLSDLSARIFGGKEILRNPFD